jgi:ribosomal-protein-alanine N-acetyltransferase
LEIELDYLTRELLPQIQELDKLCFGGFWTIDGYRRELDSPNSTILTLNAPTLAQVLGFGCFWSILEEAHITLLAVHPDYQGKGLGKLILFALLKQAWEKKLERATLEVKDTNTIALSLYGKFGFKIAGKRRGYYQPTGEDALILWRGDLLKPSFTQDLAIWQAEIPHSLTPANLSLNQNKKLFLKP